MSNHIHVLVSFIATGQRINTTEGNGKWETVHGIRDY
jgi:hypothetical protein